MVYSKKILRELERELKKQKIKAEAINKAAIEKNKCKELIRLVLKGETPDNNDIIPFLDTYLKKHLKNLAKISNNLGKY
jgi:hypothetical protein